MRESVLYKGKWYHRYPDGKYPTQRKYFQGSGGGHSYLHRDVWEAKNGPIPDGHHVHHVDGDTLHNALSNLECLPADEHRLEHRDEKAERGRSSENLALLDAARQKSVPRIESFTCSHCGKAYEAAANGKNRFCSKKCRNIVGLRNMRKRRAAERANPTPGKRKASFTCEECGSSYEAFANGRNRFCSAKCRQGYHNRQKR